MPCLALLFGPQNSGVVWSKGNVSVEGGKFFDNDALADGGVFLASEGCLLTVKGGTFENNTSVDGGVAVINGGGNLQIESGRYSGNVAEKEGGALTVYDGGVVQVGR